MKALGVLESKWNQIRQKLVRLLLEEQDKVLRSYFAQKGGTRGHRGSYAGNPWGIQVCARGDEGGATDRTLFGRDKIYFR